MIRTRNLQSSPLSMIFLHHFCRPASLMATSSASSLLLHGNTDQLPYPVPFHFHSHLPYMQICRVSVMATRTIPPVSSVLLGKTDYVPYTAPQPHPTYTKLHICPSLVMATAATSSTSSALLLLLQGKMDHLPYIVPPHFSYTKIHICKASVTTHVSSLLLLLLQGKTHHLPYTVPYAKMHIFLHPFQSNYSIGKVSTSSSVGTALRTEGGNRTHCYYSPHSHWSKNCYHHHHHGDEGDINIRDRGKTFAQSLFRQFSYDTKEATIRDTEDVDVSGKLDHDHDHDHHSNFPIGLHDQSSFQKVVVAVDVDEVLGNFLSALNMFIADRYSSKHSVLDYHVYEFFKIWNCTRDEADFRVHEFFKTSYFKSGIHPIPGARQTLEKLSRFCNLSVVTSRQNAIKDQTIDWINKHYPGLFQEIQFGNHFSLEGQSRPKSDICRSLGAKILIDDNPRYAAECAEAGMMVLLFDYENSYPWSKTGSVSQHPLVTKVHNWKEVENELLPMIVSAKL